MFGLIKELIYRHNNNAIRRLKPEVNISLSKEIPLASLGDVKRFSKVASQINCLEEKIMPLSNDQLKAKTLGFKEHIAEKDKEYKDEIFQLGERMREAVLPEEKERLKAEISQMRNELLEDILPEAFACVREAARRTIGMRHFDVQLIGGIVLHEGKIAEMATGEGKTLVATLAAYLNALLGKGVHIVTVNDYLARRDREWMGPVYEFLGLTVGVIQHDMPDAERQYAYSCDITYGTNNEFGFDYLRDNMKYRREDMVQRGFHYAIVDEVDSILIDEARTPLIISGPAEESTDKYYTACRIAGQLKGRRVTDKDEIEAKYKAEDLGKGYDYIANEKAKAISLTDEGETRAALAFGVNNLHELGTMEYRHHIIQALRAKEFFCRDTDYVVKDGEVIIVDEFTGRLMPGRRWSDGLHQAAEAKEGLKIERENQTLATISLQNYFRMYEKLAGMTGTAFTEASEFRHIYKLDTVVIPTNRQLVRTNFPDCIYKSEREKFQAISEEIIDWYEKGRPVLVGTISIEKSERLSEMLKKRGIPHQVLNAKYHEMEAQIVAQAGRFKAITIATNMAGRGTDILLGGNAEYMTKNLLRQKGLKPEDPDYQKEYEQLFKEFKAKVDEEHRQVVEVGGLHVIGTERHEARRIDNQLRGRAGRQGDPGSSRFYISLEDDLMRLFGSDAIMRMMDKLGMEEGQVIEHPLVTKAIEVAQKRVETHNFEIRKQLLEYDNVMNKQRDLIYGQRRMVFESSDLKEYILAMAEDILERNIGRYISKETSNCEGWDWEGLRDWLKEQFGMVVNIDDLKKLDSASEVKEHIYEMINNIYGQKEVALGDVNMRSLERDAMLQVIDTRWKEHLYNMDILREGIGLRAYGQRDPLIEYQSEAFDMFQEMVENIKEQIVESIFKIEAVKEERLRRIFSDLSQELLHQEFSSLAKDRQGTSLTSSQTRSSSAKIPSSKKVGRNDPCPCGSGKKYKKCCGR